MHNLTLAISCSLGHRKQKPGQIDLQVKLKSQLNEKAQNMGRRPQQIELEMPQHLEQRACGQVADFRNITLFGVRVATEQKVEFRRLSDRCRAAACRKRGFPAGDRPSSACPPLRPNQMISLTRRL